MAPSPPSQPDKRSVLSTPPTQRESLSQLPAELVREICGHLPNSDIKNLRLTCSLFVTRAPLRLDRVFLSANTRNVEVFNAIASHETLCAQITEIIWDDALLTANTGNNRHYPGDDYGDYEEEDDDEEEEDPLHPETGCPRWYRKACRDNLEFIDGRQNSDVEKSFHAAIAQQVERRIPLREAWAYYQTLLQQERDVLSSEAHVQALKTGLARFPALRSITITPAAHGRLFEPLYETPMIRSFPRGFNYLIPRGWPVPTTSYPEAPQWDDGGNDWPGFRSVMRVLAQNQDSHNVTKVRIDANELETGLNIRVFERRCASYADFAALLAGPNVRHLHLDLLVGQNPFTIFRNGLLGRALVGASGGRGLEHISLRTNLEPSNDYGVNECHVPLQTVFPAASLSRLQHFGLSHFYVKQDDLLDLLTALPDSLLTIELSFLGFFSGNYRGLLLQMRDTLGWKDRTSKPRVRISLAQDFCAEGWAIWIDDEVNAFLYSGGVNPFGDDTSRFGPNQVLLGTGILKDAFQPRYDRPNVSPVMLMRLGYSKIPAGWTEDHIEATLNERTRMTG